MSENSDIGTMPGLMRFYWAAEVTAVSLRSDISIAANLASLIDQRCTWRQAGQRNSASLRGMPAKVRMSTMWPVSTSTLLAGDLMTTLNLCATHLEHALNSRTELACISKNN